MELSPQGHSLLNIFNYSDSAFFHKGKQTEENPLLYMQMSSKLVGGLAFLCPLSRKGLWWGWPEMLAILAYGFAKPKPVHDAGCGCLMDVAFAHHWSITGVCGDYTGIYGVSVS